MRAGGSTEEETARSSAQLTSRHQRPPSGEGNERAEILAVKADDEDDCAVSMDTAESHSTLQGRGTSFRSRNLPLLLLLKFSTRTSTSPLTKVVACWST